MDGLHVVANLYRCRGEARYLTDAAALRQFCHDSINRAGLTILGDLFHEFDGGGVTGTVVLAESHLAIHTWPELQSVTLDVYVCNYTQDNGAKARQVVTDLMDLYRPEEHVQHDVPRDKRFMYEWLNGDYGFFLRSSKLIEASKTRFQDLEIHETPQFGKLFRLDGCFMTSEREEFVYHETLIHPALAALSAPKRVLVIGGGDGGAAEEALKHPSVDQVILVELDEKVVEISKEHFGAIHRGVFANPKLKLLIDDGLKYLSETKEKFDHIALDLPDPIGPATALYEEAFFRDCKRALAPGGVLTLHMGSPWSRPDRVRMLYGRLAKMFKIARPYTMFIPLYGCLWSMCACSDSTDVVSVSATEIDARVSARGVTHLQYYNGATHQALFALPNFVRELTVDAVPKPRLVAAKKRVAVGAK
ncbi:MAG: polyamine aminopropyltransferase [Betaproteobacteria bacterium]|nr:MAG: polyamine aminopropyltransferase [Betaproteobacteria bacterium]TMG75098.1 MAG: polyamine aminopropyltransferase [Betaproteobacteria bacterium]